MQNATTKFYDKQICKFFRRCTFERMAVRHHTEDNTKVMPGRWVLASAPPVGCPPGLEYLTPVNQVLVHQQVRLPEMFSGWETSNRYSISNKAGRQMYFVAEDSNCCCRLCCGPYRSFDIHIMDSRNQEGAEHHVSWRQTVRAEVIAASIGVQVLHYPMFVRFVAVVGIAHKGRRQSVYRGRQSVFGYDAAKNRFGARVPRQ
ncbi:Phospholipid scramblase 1 [Lamellibrachia satsuma]|nr:Phospholipid scramblase 1 [Lamellibrachia satsuma]